MKRLSVLAAVLASLATTAAAQDYPTRQVTLILPFVAGGAIDLAARIWAQKLSDRWGKPVIVENRPGAGTVIASNLVAKAAPDGHTLYVAPSALAISPTLFKKLPFDVAADFAPVARIADNPLILAVNASLPVRSIAELVQYAKERPGQLSYASSGPGSTLHLSGELLKRITGIEMAHIPYKGGPPAMNDVVAGHVQLIFADPASALAQLREGRVRALGVANDNRTPAAPEIPTLKEAGLPGFDAVAWVLIVAPAATPKAIVNKLHAELKIVAALPETREQIIKIGMVPYESPSPEELQGFLKSEIARWGKLVEQAGIAGSE